MKIALLTDGIYPDHIGGMQKHSAYLAKYLARSGVEIELYVRDVEQGRERNTELFTAEERAGIRFHYVPFPATRYFPGHYLWQSYRYSSSIFELLKANGTADFVYAQGFAGWRLLREKRRGFECSPVGVHFHGLDIFQHAPSFKASLQQLLLRPAVAAQLCASDAAFSLGGRLDAIIRSQGVPPERICHSPNGVEASWLVDSPRQPDSLRRFLFVGRYARLKGVEELARVIERLAAAGVPFEFDFVGPIPDQLRLKQSRVRYHGTVTDSAQMQAIMQGCDCLVCPSYAEGMPTVIMEAMASGLAVVATDVGAVPAMLDDGSGLLIPPGDEGALELALRRVIDLPDAQLLAMKRAGLERARKDFLWETVAATTLEQIQRIIQRHAH